MRGGISVKIERELLAGWDHSVRMRWRSRCASSGTCSAGIARSKRSCLIKLPSVGWATSTSMNHCTKHKFIHSPEPLSWAARKSRNSTGPCAARCTPPSAPAAARSATIAHPTANAAGSKPATKSTAGKANPADDAKRPSSASRQPAAVRTSVLNVNRSKGDLEPWASAHADLRKVRTPHPVTAHPYLHARRSSHPANVRAG